MNKKNLVSAVADAAGLTMADATKAVESLISSVTDALINGDEVRLVGFGTFFVTERAASTGRTPRTSDTIEIPASRQPKFKAGKGLKDAMN